MPHGPSNNARVLRRLPWAVAAALAVGLGWLGVTRLVGIVFDRDAVLLVAGTFVLLLVNAALEPAPPSRTDPGEAASAVAPDDVILPEERHQPIVFPLILWLIGAALSVFLLAVAAWTLMTQHGEADALAAKLAVFGLLMGFMTVHGWFDLKRTLRARHLERGRRNGNTRG